MTGTGSPRVAGRPERQETLLPGRDRFTGRNPDQAGQVDLTVKNMLTRLTRHGLAARLGWDVNVGLGAMKVLQWIDQGAFQ